MNCLTVLIDSFFLTTIKNNNITNKMTKNAKNNSLTMENIEKCSRKVLHCM